jgi:hypothetical protein
MKYSREFSIPLFVRAMGICIAWASMLCAQISNSNPFNLKIAITNDVAVFTISSTPVTNAVGAYDLFFKTNVADAQGWTWLFRCPASQTNLVLTNLSPCQGYFMLGVPNAIRPGFDTLSLPLEDDYPSSRATLPFTMNYFGAVYSNVWVNNNGNVTFDGYLQAFTPNPLNQLGSSGITNIIAPYWADVDTRDAGSGLVTYGSGVVGTNSAFGVNWVNVGYYYEHSDRLLSCQLVIIDRSADYAPGDFDVEFNYNKVQWEWGDASRNFPPRAGFSNGDKDYELAGSGGQGNFVDTNVLTGLIYHNLNSPVLGRYIFYFRNGEPLP